ncbi:sigma-70 family RNA polymerase sigma factor [Mangrovivirga sp. M17]|uniref:RNA polymerase sigma factor n=1 Tax=Mangrovivirga halotolerans TaxID=2993936 RepID=A0ABT3RTZ6_9BACT|nr:sigma-70 family RNA polymerase sigma factor [Mangrovivirga halotolerans]
MEEQLTKNNLTEIEFSVILTNYKERIYWHIRKMVIDHDDSDDITQDTFIKVYENLEKFKGDSDLFTWIYRIATNECLKFLRKKKRASIFSFSSLESELNNSLTSSVYVDGNEVEIKLQKALLKLPDKQRLIFNMKYFDNMSYEEISSITETSVGGLKASYHHAVKKIKKYISLPD